jgi:O-acetyl-ADP-ribose deacetylase (regulator of RNase III)
MQIIKGNMFNSKANTLVNPINCVGVMGKGLAKEFKNRFPEMFKDYKNKCDKDKIKVGKVYFYKTDTMNIINFPTKMHWRPPSSLDWIEEGLDYLVDNYQLWGIESLAIPALGCGLGGLLWEEVGPIMYEKLKDLPIPVELYVPLDAPTSQTTKDYLENN